MRTDRRGGILGFVKYRRQVFATHIVRYDHNRLRRSDRCSFEFDTTRLRDVRGGMFALNVVW